MPRKILAVLFSVMLVAVSASVLAGVAANNGWTSRAAIGSPVRARYLTDNYGMALADASNRDPNSVLYCAIDDPYTSARPQCGINATTHDAVVGLMQNPRNYFSTATDSDYLDFAGDFYMCMVYEPEQTGGKVIYQNGTYNTGSAVNNSGFRIGSENNYAYITIFTPNGNYSATTPIPPKQNYTNLLCWGRTSSTFWIKLNDGTPSTTIVGAYVPGTNAPARLGIGWQDSNAYSGADGMRFAEISAASSGLTRAQQDALWTVTANCTKSGRCLPTDANEVGYYSGDAYRTGGKWYADTAMTVSKALTISGTDSWYGAWTVPARYTWGARERANYLTYSNLLANGAWTKDSGVTVEDASADCPTLADGTPMSKITSSTNNNGVRQSVTGIYNPASRQAWMARPLSATSDCTAAMSTATNPNSERLQKVVSAAPKWFNYNNTTWSGALGIDLTRGNTGILQRSYYENGGATPAALASVGNYRYGLSYIDGTTMMIWDGSDPDAWVFLRNLTLPVRPCTHRTIRDGNYLYVNGADRLMVLDVSTPENPTVAGQVSISGSNEQCNGMAKVGNYIVSSGRKQYLQVIDVSTPTAPVLKGTAAGTGVCVSTSWPNGGCDGLDTYGGYVYVYHSDSTMNVYDVTTDPMVPALVASGVMPKGGTGSGKAVVVFDHYMAKFENDRLRIWDLTTPLAPTLAGQQTGLSYAIYGNSTSAVRGNYVYVSSEWLARFDVSNPAAPTRDRDAGTSYWGGIVPITDDMVFASTVWSVGRRYFDLQLGVTCPAFCVANPMVESNTVANQFCGPTTSEPLLCPGGGKYFGIAGSPAVNESSVYAKGLGNRFAGVTGFASGDSYFSKPAGSELDHQWGTRCVLYTTGDDVTTDQHVVGNYDVNPGPFGAGFRISLDNGVARCNGYGAGGLEPNTTYVTCCARHGSGVGYKTNDMTEWEVGTHPQTNTAHATTLGTGYAYSGDNQWHPFKGVIHEFADYPHVALGQGGMQRALNKRVMACSTPLPCFQRSTAGAATNHCWASEQGVWTCGTGTAWTKIGTPQPAAPERRRFGAGDLSSASIKRDFGTYSAGNFTSSDYFYGESPRSVLDFKDGFTCHAVYSRDNASYVNGTILSDGNYGATGAGWAMRSHAAGGVLLQTFTSGSGERTVYTASYVDAYFGVNLATVGRSADGTTGYVKINGQPTYSSIAYNTRDTLTTTRIGYEPVFGTLNGKLWEVFCTSSAWSESEVTRIHQDFLAMRGTGGEPMTVTRSTEATAASLGRVSRVPAGAPRATVLGRLYESQDINLSTYSEQFDQWTSVFNVTATTYTANSANGVDGGISTADTLNVPSVTGSDYSARCINFTATAAPHTGSVWVKSTSGTVYPHIYFWDGASAYYSATCTAYSPYWYTMNCKVTATLTAAVWKLCIGHDRRDAAQTSTPAASFYTWGANLTATSFMQQYCGPTVASARTCNADEVRVPTALQVSPNPSVITNSAPYSSTLANAVWSKSSGVTVTDADATHCPNDPHGVRMSYVDATGSGGVGAAIGQDVSSTRSRSVYLAHSTGGSACGLSISDYFGTNPDSYATTASAYRYTGGLAGDEGILVQSAGTDTEAASTQVGTDLGGYMFKQSILDGNYLYLLMMSAPNSYLKIVDISTNPPTYKSTTTNLGGYPAGGIAKSGNTVFHFQGNSSNAIAINVTNPSSPTTSTVSNSCASQSMVETGNGYIYTADLNAYWGASNKIMVCNGSTAAKVGELAGYASLGNTNPVMKITYYDGGASKYIYLTYYGTKSIVVVDVTNPAAPTYVRTVTHPNYEFMSSRVIGTNLITWYSTSGTPSPDARKHLEVWSLADPSTPTLTYTSGLIFGNYGLMQSASYGNYLYLGTYDVSNVPWLTQVDLTDPSSPTAVSVSVTSKIFPGNVDPGGNPVGPPATPSLNITGSTLWVGTDETGDQHQRVEKYALPFVGGCASWCQSSAQLETAATVGAFCGQTQADPKVCGPGQQWCVRVLDPQPENDRAWLSYADRYWVDNAYLDGNDRIYMGTPYGTSSPRAVVTDLNGATLTADMGITPSSYAKLDARLCGQNGDIRLYTDAQTAVLMHFDGFGTTFTDSSAYRRTWTRNLSSTQESTAQKKFGTRSLLVDRNLDGWVKTAHTTDLEVPANPFTMDFWHYAVYDAGALGSGTEFYLMTQAAAGAFSPIAITQESGTNLVLRLSTDCATWTHTAAIGTTTKNAWHHIAVVRESPTGAFKTYLDGVAGATTGAGITLCNSSADFYLGGASGGTFSIGGYLDEFRFVKNVPLWTGAFTPPTLPAIGREWYGVRATGTGNGFFKKTGPTWQVGWTWDGTINGVEFNQSGDYRDF